MPDKKTLTEKELEAKRVAKLKELAAMRVPKAVNAVRILGNLANYKPNQVQADAIVKQIEDAIKGVKARFAGQTAQEGFTLPS